MKSLLGSYLYAFYLLIVEKRLYFSYILGDEFLPFGNKIKKQNIHSETFKINEEQYPLHDIT